jgi:flagellar basal body P-ring protein FlgI
LCQEEEKKRKMSNTTTNIITETENQVIISTLTNPSVEDIIRQINRLTVSVAELINILQEMINKQSTLLNQLSSSNEKMINIGLKQQQQQKKK